MLKKSCMSLFVIVGLLLVNSAYAVPTNEIEPQTYDNPSIIKAASSQDGKHNYQRPTENEPRECCLSACCPIHCKIDHDYDICGCYYATCQVGNGECNTYNPCFVACIAVTYLPRCFVEKCLCIEDFSR